MVASPRGAMRHKLSGRASHVKRAESPRRPFEDPPSPPPDCSIHEDRAIWPGRFWPLATFALGLRRAGAGARDPGSPTDAARVLTLTQGEGVRFGVVSEAGKTWRVGELAQMAGLTVRALHHYDQVGLLVPSDRSASGYRLYGEGDVRRL